MLGVNLEVVGAGNTKERLKGWLRYAAMYLEKYPFLTAKHSTWLRQMMANYNQCDTPTFKDLGDGCYKTIAQHYDQQFKQFQLDVIAAENAAKQASASPVPKLTAFKDVQYTASQAQQAQPSYAPSTLSPYAWTTSQSDSLSSLSTTPEGREFSFEIAQSSDPVKSLTTPSADKKSAFLTWEQILALTSTLFQGYSGAKQAEVRAQMWALQAQGVPIQLPETVNTELKVKTMNWTWLGLGFLGIVGVGLVGYALTRPGKAATATPMLAAPTMKMLPAPA